MGVSDKFLLPCPQVSHRFQSHDSPPHLYRLKKLNYQSVSFVSLEFPGHQVSQWQQGQHRRTGQGKEGPGANSRERHLGEKAVAEGETEIDREGSHSKGHLCMQPGVRAHTT